MSDYGLASRSSFSATASRTKAARPYVPTNASIFANASGDSRTGTRVKLSGGRPIGRGVSELFCGGNKTAPFSLATLNGAVYVNGTQYEGKPTMRIDYKSERLAEPTNKFRMALMEIRWLVPEGGPLDTVDSDDGAPATDVLNALDFELGRTSFRAEIDAVRPALEEFRVFVLREVEREKAAAMAAKLVKQCAKAGLGYRQAQNAFNSALEAQADKFPMSGW